MSVIQQELSSSWDRQPFGHSRHGPKSGRLLCPFPWGLSPHLTQCRLGRGLPRYQVASWSIQPFGHNTPTLQTDSTGQTDRQVNGPVAYGKPLLVTVSQKNR